LGKSLSRGFSAGERSTHFIASVGALKPRLLVILDCGASLYGVFKPIAFGSRPLSPAEKKYSLLDKEGLAIVFGVKKFHQYLAGCIFTIYSDHKPLQHIFAEDFPIPAMTLARIQRWALTLSAYNYTITYKPGSQHGNTDLLHRLPLPGAPTEVGTLSHLAP